MFEWVLGPPLDSGAAYDAQGITTIRECRPEILKLSKWQAGPVRIEQKEGIVLLFCVLPRLG